MISARFESKFSRRENGCWEWTASLNSGGYGCFWFNGKQWVASRFALTASKGAAPAGKPWALHTCDNPKCVNPDHLYWGTAIQNTADRSQRNRTAVGERHGTRTRPDRVVRGELHAHAKLSDMQRIDVYILRRLGGTFRNIAACFDVTEGTIRYVCRRMDAA